MNVYIDLGYYSYRVGIFENTPFAFWKWPYPELGKPFFLADSPQSRRRLEYPAYKSARTERKASDEKAADMAYRAAQWQNQAISPMFGYNNFSILGYEADDMVGLLPPGSRVVGIDKDYAQLGGRLSFYNAAGESVNPADNFIAHAPNFLAPFLEGKGFGVFAVAQALTGDASDSIPRVLPRHGAREKIRLLDAIINYRDVTVLDETIRNQFFTNLRLTALPHPALTLKDRQYDASPELLLSDLLDDVYGKSEIGVKPL